ncbi:hypothetical protein WKK05_36485 (plasmid) [Nostoc sp. UHCC 0302]
MVTNSELQLLSTVAMSSIRGWLELQMVLRVMVMLVVLLEPL